MNVGHHRDARHVVHVGEPAQGCRHVLAHCGGRRNVVAFVADATRARSLLTTIGLPAEPATFAPTRAPPQAELIWQDPP